MAAPRPRSSTAAPISTKIIEPIVKGGYYHAGQVCVSTQRIFVHADIADDFAERLVARVETLRVGDPTLARHRGRAADPAEGGGPGRDWIEEAVERRRELAVGGGRLRETTLQPTVLLEPAREAKVSREEVFGPVTCVYRYHRSRRGHRAARIRLPVAFQASVFAQDIDVALRAADRLDASTVMINDHTAFRTDWMPFAGRSESGYGIGGIPFTMRDMTQEKMILMRRS